MFGVCGNRIMATKKQKLEIERREKIKIEALEARLHEAKTFEDVKMALAFFENSMTS